jgi:hypothetical protein
VLLWLDATVRPRSVIVLRRAENSRLVPRFDEILASGYGGRLLGSRLLIVRACRTCRISDNLVRARANLLSFYIPFRSDNEVI